MNRQMMTGYLHAYLYGDDPSVFPLDEAALHGFQFRGQRNYGYGLTRLKYTQAVALEMIDCSHLEIVNEYLIELMPSFALTGEYPYADDDTVQCW